jgi:hypothetical protein
MDARVTWARVIAGSFQFSEHRSATCRAPPRGALRREMASMPMSQDEKPRSSRNAQWGVPGQADRYP